MTPGFPDRTIQVLLAEDNPGDVRLTREALRVSNLRINLNVARDGEEALAFLKKEGRFADAPRAELVILDLNMPKVNGLKVLDEMRKDPGLDCIPVVIFTSSDAQEDIVSSYKLRANAYVTKPTYIELYNGAVRKIEEFWLRTAQLPLNCSEE